MRSNLPVTNVEYPLADDCLIVSKTDIKGRITYYNQSFLDASGFSPQELMGAPHNIVRHPDMPPEAFANLWDTVKAGRPWYGAVKNRRKDGSYYWVMASVSPTATIVEIPFSTVSRPRRKSAAMAASNGTASSARSRPSTA